MRGRGVRSRKMQSRTPKCHREKFRNFKTYKVFSPAQRRDFNPFFCFFCVSCMLCPEASQKTLFLTLFCCFRFFVFVRGAEKLVFSPLFGPTFVLKCVLICVQESAALCCVLYVGSQFRTVRLKTRSGALWRALVRSGALCGALRRCAKFCDALRRSGTLWGALGL